MTGPAGHSWLGTAGAACVAAMLPLAFAGTALAANVSGDGGSNVLIGTAGPDRLAGRAGNDAIYGLGGRDRILPGAGGDVSYGGPGRDRFFGSPGADTYLGGSANDMVGFPGDKPVLGEADRGSDRAFGAAGNDFLDTGFGADVLVGGAGDDDFRPEQGADTVFAGTGNDRVIMSGDRHRDVIHCGPGRDLVAYYGVTPSEEPDATYGCERVEAQ